MHVFISHRYSRRPRTLHRPSQHPCNASIPRKYVLSKRAARHSVRGVRAYHDLDSVAARACFDIVREEHVSARRISEQECPCERGIREEKEINNWNSKDISLISEIVRGERGIARLVTITLECKVRARSKCNLCATRIIYDFYYKLCVYLMCLYSIRYMWMVNVTFTHHIS